MLKLSFKFGSRLRGGKASAFGVRGVSIWTNPQTGKKCPRIRFTLYDSDTGEAFPVAVTAHHSVPVEDVVLAAKTAQKMAEDGKIPDETYLRQLLVWMRAWLDSKRSGTIKEGERQT